MAGAAEKIRDKGDFSVLGVSVPIREWLAG